MTRLNHISWIRRLVRKFPNAFCYPPRPLRVGITYEAAAAFSRQFLERNPRLEDAIGLWVSRPEYLSACVAGAVRVDLQGKPAGVVTEAEASYAAAALAKLETPEG